MSVSMGILVISHGAGWDSFLSRKWSSDSVRGSPDFSVMKQKGIMLSVKILFFS